MCFCDKSKKYESKPDIQRITEEIKIHPQEVYNEGIALCKQDRYGEAQKLFFLVKKVAPGFPYIESNISQCVQLYWACQYYNQGIQLCQESKFQEALNRFAFIDEKIQPDFKKCNEYITICQNEIWKEYYKDKILDSIFDIKIKQFQERLRQKPKQCKRLEREKQQNIDKLNKLKKEQHQNEDNQNIGVSTVVKIMNKDDKKKENSQEVNNQDKEQERKIDENPIPELTEKPNFEDKQFDKTQLYYQCTRQPQCENFNPDLLFQHKTCGRAAYFNSNGFVSCDNKSCVEFSIKDAVFQCSSQAVFKKDVNGVESGYEWIRDEMWYADFLETCLQHDPRSEGAKFMFTIQAITIIARFCVKKDETT